jgi:hypothetical protein
LRQVRDSVELRGDLGEIPRSFVRSRRVEMIQQGQVFKLKTKGPDGQPLWAYQHRLEGRGSERPQVGGFATRGEAKALRKVLDRLGPGGGRATIMLAEFVDEYLEMHQAELVVAPVDSHPHAARTLPVYVQLKGRAVWL